MWKPIQRILGAIIMGARYFHHASWNSLSNEENCDIIIKKHIPIVSEATAIIFLVRMYDGNLMYHPDDDPEEIFAGSLTPIQIQWVQVCMDQAAYYLEECETGDIYGQSLTIINQVYQP